MKMDGEVLRIFEEIRRNGTDTVEVSANGKIYHVEVDVYNVFTRNCKESPENFLARINPEDDDAASYRMSIYASRVIRERKRRGPMSKLKVICENENITLDPFDKNDSVMAELNEFLQGCRIRPVIPPLEIDIEMDFDNGMITALFSGNGERYTSPITDELDNDLIDLVGFILEVEEIEIPLASTIYYDQSETDEMWELDEEDDFES